MREAVVCNKRQEWRSSTATATTTTKGKTNVGGVLARWFYFAGSFNANVRSIYTWMRGSDRVRPAHKSNLKLTSTQPI